MGSSEQRESRKSLSERGVRCEIGSAQGRGHARLTCPLSFQHASVLEDSSITSPERSSHGSI